MKKVVFLLLILTIVVVSPFKVEASQHKFVLFIMDGVDLSEIKEVETPNLDKLIVSGAIGLMNTRTAGSLEPKDAYLTLGAGDRARAGTAAYLNFNSNEDYKQVKAKDLYLRRSEYVGTKAKIMNIEFSKIISTNKSSNYQAEVGYLADSLTQSNLDISVLGNADIWQQPRRHIAMIGINKYGVISQGDVGHRMILRSDQDPSGYITNQNYLLKKFKQELTKSDLIVVESGDTSRIEAVDYLLNDKKFITEKEKAINRVDNLLGKIVKHLNFSKDYLLVVIPTPSKAGKRKGNKLTLTVFKGVRIKGLLTSGTTKRAGLITNLDIAPTIYRYLKGKNAKFTGRGINSVSSAKSIDYLIELSNKIKTTFRWRPLLVKGFILLQIITLALVGIILIYKDSPFLLKEIVKYLLLGLLWIPNFFLLSKLVIGQNLILVSLSWLGLSFLFTHYLLKKNSHELIPILVPALITLILLVIDLWTGARLIKLSVLGYSPVIGARFYGIGNEFMGVIIGAGMIAFAALKEIKESISIFVVVALFILLILTVGHPKLGANFGGLITATTVCIVTYFNLRNYQFNLKNILKLSLILIFTIIMIALLDIIGNSTNQTHLAHTLFSIKTGGISKIVTIIYRKLSMNLKLLRWTIWSRVLLAFVIVLIILFRRPRGKLRDIVIRYSNLEAAFRGLIVGSVVTMLVNDSGVVAAATLLLFPVFTLLFLVLKRIKLT